jgi:prevent-host-death family protein
MPALKEVTSRDARTQWREILDEVMTGSSDIAITRYGKPVAVMIPAEDYESVADHLEELRLGRMAEAAYSKYLANRNNALPYEELRKDILEED